LLPWAVELSGQKGKGTGPGKESRSGNKTKGELKEFAGGLTKSLSIRMKGVKVDFKNFGLSQEVRTTMVTMGKTVRSRLGRQLDLLLAIGQPSMFSFYCCIPNYQHSEFKPNPPLAHSSVVSSSGGFH
jgi:hypothetical protein